MSGVPNYIGVRGQQNIIAIWPHAAPLITRAIRVYNDHTLEEIFESLLARKRQLWIGGTDNVDCILITQIIFEKDEKVCFIELYAGRGLEFIKHFPGIENWAKQAGCSRMKLSGRQGWKRVLKDYNVKNITLEKEL